MEVAASTTEGAPSPDPAAAAAANAPAAAAVESKAEMAASPPAKLEHGLGVVDQEEPLSTRVSKARQSIGQRSPSKVQEDDDDDVPLSTRVSTGRTSVGHRHQTERGKGKGHEHEHDHDGDDDDDDSPLSTRVSTTRESVGHQKNHARILKKEQENDDDDTPLSTRVSGVSATAPRTSSGARVSVAAVAAPGYRARSSTADLRSSVATKAVGFHVDDDDECLDEFTPLSRIAESTSPRPASDATPIVSGQGTPSVARNRPAPNANTQSPPPPPIIIPQSTTSRPSVTNRVSATSVAEVTDNEPQVDVQRSTRASISGQNISSNAVKRRRAASVGASPMPPPAALIDTSNSPIAPTPASDASISNLTDESISSSVADSGVNFSGRADAVAAVIASIDDPEMRAVVSSVAQIMMLKFEPFMSDTAKSIKQLKRSIGAIEARTANIESALGGLDFSAGGGPRVVPNIFKGASKPTPSQQGSKGGKPLMDNRQFESTATVPEIMKDKLKQAPTLQSPTGGGFPHLSHNGVAADSPASQHSPTHVDNSNMVASGGTLMDALSARRSVCRADGSQIRFKRQDSTSESPSTAEPEYIPMRQTCVRCEGIGWQHIDQKRKHDRPKNVQCKACSHCGLCGGTGVLLDKVPCKTCGTFGFVHHAQDAPLPSCATGLRCSGCLTCSLCAGNGVVDVQTNST